MEVDCIEEVVQGAQSITVDQEHHDRTLLMSHLCAYRVAGELARGKSFLEIGSGGGYGSFYISSLAREVTAIDIDEKLVDQARRLFHRPNLRYNQGNGLPLKFPDGRFECVGLFQVIEHIPETQLPAFVSELERVLTPDGMLIVSTMNLNHNCKGKPDDYVKVSFHEKEFTEPELRDLLKRVFPAVELYGLYPRWRYRFFKRLKRWGLHKWGPSSWNPVRRFIESELSTSDHIWRPDCNRQAIDLLAICYKQPLATMRKDRVDGNGAILGILARQLAMEPSGDGSP